MRNDAPLNEKVGGVEATDGEGVRYRLEPGQSSESALTYFRVEPESGDIVLQGDLTNELYTEYRLAVTAYDLGTPSLQTTVELRVVVEQVVTLPSNTMDSHTINMRDARQLGRAEIFLKIFPSVKLEIFHRHHGLCQTEL